jgi:hypothetical protein
MPRKLLLQRERDAFAIGTAALAVGAPVAWLATAWALSQAAAAASAGQRASPRQVSHHSVASESARLPSSAGQRQPAVLCGWRKHLRGSIGSSQPIAVCVSR